MNTSQEASEIKETEEGNDGFCLFMLPQGVDVAHARCQQPVCPLCNEMRNAITLGKTKSSLKFIKVAVWNIQCSS